MIDGLLLMLVPLVVGAALASWLGRQPGRRGWHVAAGVAAVPAVLLALFPVAQWLHSDALGWVAGLSLMVLGVFGLPLAAGLAIGWFWARRRGPPAAASPAARTVAEPAKAPDGAAAPDPVADAARAGLRARQRGLLMAIAGVGAGFWVGIALGFRLHGQVAPAPLDAGLPLAAAVLVLTLAAGARWLWRRRPRPLRPPDRAPAGGGVSWSGGAPGDDAPAAGCCDHLAPLVARMRQAGVAVRPHGPGTAHAACRVDAAAQGLPATVVSEEIVLQERSSCDGYAARLRCTACESTLWVLHPAESPPGAAWFPGPPAAGAG